MRHVIDYRPPWERKRRRPWAPGETHQVIPAAAAIPTREYSVLLTPAEGSPLQLKLIDTRDEQKKGLTQAVSLT